MKNKIMSYIPEVCKDVHYSNNFFLSLLMLVFKIELMIWANNVGSNASISLGSYSGALPLLYC